MQKEADERNQFETWLENSKLPQLPYIKALGPIDQLNNIFIILNKEKYLQPDLVKAVEVLFKVYSALHSWPLLCDYVWCFIQQYVYQQTPS